MAPDPLISVIIPAYNRSAVIAKAIGSALEQDYTRIEVVVIDDCSKDDTATVVAAIPDPRVRLLRHDKNRGASGARNTGILAATGELIAFLDSDDSWFPAKLTRNLAFMRSHGLTETAKWFAYNRCEVRTELGARVSQSPATHDLTLAEILFCNQGFIQTSAVFLPSNLAKKALFSEEVSWVDDWEFLLRLDDAGAPLSFQDEVLTIHNAFSAATRVSNGVSADALVRWIESRRPSLSRREIAGFYANRVAPQLILAGKRRQALKFLAEGVVAKAVSPRALAIEVARAAVPDRAFRSLRKHLGRSR